MTRPFTESVEEAAVRWLETAGWRVAYGLDIAPDMPAAERADYGEVVQRPPAGGDRTQESGR